ncbi:MAG TPA: hypothetical protein VM864_15290 [Pyrinomonadaceae bacterium]|nr:hypothetical protein [Pyrinomonadaceae bacterium]
MSPVFLITLLLIAAIAYTIYRKERQHGATQERELYPPSPRSLFPEGEEVGRADSAHRLAAAPEAARRGALLERAGGGDVSALAEAQQLGGAEFYQAVLARSLRRSESSDEDLRSLAAHVASGETLRGSVELSRAFGRLWEASPDAASTARALHLAALCDDAAEYERAMEVALRLRLEGRIPDVGEEELRALLDAEFWVMSPEARASGAAFVVKQQLAALRADLAARAPQANPINE